MVVLTFNKQTSLGTRKKQRLDIRHWRLNVGKHIMDNIYQEIAGPRYYRYPQNLDKLDIISLKRQIPNKETRKMFI